MTNGVLPGADGFIGSDVAEALTKPGHQAQTVDRLTSPAKVDHLPAHPTDVQPVVIDTARCANDEFGKPLKLMSLAQGLEETSHYL